MYTSGGMNCAGASLFRNIEDDRVGIEHVRNGTGSSMAENASMLVLTQQI